MNSYTPPFAAILESQPPWWRLGGGGALVVSAYLAMLLAALNLGHQPAAQTPPKPASRLVVTLLDHPTPAVELPVQASAPGDTSARAPAALPPAVKPLRAKPKEHPTTPTATETAPETNPHPTAAGDAPGPAVVSTMPARVESGGADTANHSPTGTPVGHGPNDLTVMPFADGMTRPKLLDMVEPEYTREARDANVKGLFLAKCVITVQGALQKCRVIKGLPMMDQAVLSALARWRYTPVIYQGRAVAVDYVIQVRLAGP